VNIAEKPELRVGKTAEEAAHDCAEFILAKLTATLQSKNRATLAISGGSTPRLLFSDLAAQSFDWSNVHFFWVDERCVPIDNSQSNYKLAYDTLLGPAHIPAANIHRIHGELPPAEGGKRYIADIKSFFGLADGEIPVFDIVHRGMGPDAHTASLFPGSPLVHDHTGIATNVWVEKMKMDRITLLPAVLEAATHTVLQVSGAEKADALKSVLEAPEDLLKYPCQIASRDSRAVWFLDAAAASKL
jgi:6-phosphogluconolactonase